MKWLASLLAVPSLATGAVPAVEMAVPRAAHTATLLASGDVLLVGGCSADSCELDERGATTEIFDAATNQMRSGPRLRAARVGHVAVPLPDGKVLIAGGWLLSGVTASAEMFVPSRSVFVATEPMNTARGGAVAVRLRDGRALVVGGSRGARILRSAEIFDAAAGGFTSSGSMSVARVGHAAVRLRDGRVLVVGGSNGGRVLASTEIYDPRSGRFVRGPRLQTARHKHAAVVLRDGSILVVGGSDERDWRGRLASAELWRPGARRFVAVDPLSARRFKLPDAVAVLPDGRVLVAGGSARLELYEPSRRRFVDAGRIDHELAFATATALRDGRVLVAGGYDNALRVERRAWLVTPATP